MKNNRGQILILFVLLLPLLILFLAYVIDISRLNYEKNKVNDIAKSTIIYVKNNSDVSDDEVKDFVKKNDEDITITIDDKDGYKITLEKKINSFFSKIVDKDKYTIKVVVDK